MFHKYQQFFLCTVATLAITACTTNGNLFTMDIGDLRTEAEVVNKFVETICANPVVQTHLTTEARDQLTALENKVQQTLTAMESSEKETISIEVGNNWDKYLISDLSQVLGVLSPITSQLDPSLNNYIQLGYSVIEILQTLKSNNVSTPASHTATTMALPTVNRDKVNLAVWAGPQS